MPWCGGLGFALHLPVSGFPQPRVSPAIRSTQTFVARYRTSGLSAEQTFSEAFLVFGATSASRCSLPIGHIDLEFVQRPATDFLFH